MALETVGVSVTFQVTGKPINDGQVRLDFRLRHIQHLVWVKSGAGEQRLR